MPGPPPELRRGRGLNNRASGDLGEELARRYLASKGYEIVESALNYAIFATDPEGRLTTWTPAAEAVFGWTADELLGRPFTITYTPEDRAEGVPEKELTTARRDGVAPT